MLSPTKGFYMLLDVLFLSAGLALLYFGAEYLVRGSANVAMILGVSPLMVGLTVVAFGTSAPELVACLMAVYQGVGDIALGNVIGSNIANIGLVLGMAAVVSAIVIEQGSGKSELCIMFGFTALFIILSLDGVISRLDGFIFVSGIVSFTVYCIIVARRGREATLAMPTQENVCPLADKSHGLGYEIGLTAVGIALVMLGAYLLIDSAASLARQFGISELVIGVTIVALGTSLPELATATLAAYRGHSALAYGNVVGSNIFNIGLILGLTALASPLRSPPAEIYVELALLGFFTLALAPAAWSRRIGPAYGGVLLGGYALFMAWIALVKVG